MSQQDSNQSPEAQSSVAQSQATRIISSLKTGTVKTLRSTIQWLEKTEYAVSRYGFSAIEVYPDRLQIEGIGTDGLVFDRGIVTRQAQVAV